MLFCQQVGKIFPENANTKLRQKPSPAEKGDRFALQNGG
jgi:hypothetical protein